MQHIHRSWELGCGHFVRRSRYLFQLTKGSWGCRHPKRRVLLNFLVFTATAYLVYSWCLWVPWFNFSLVFSCCERSDNMQLEREPRILSPSSTFPHPLPSPSARQEHWSGLSGGLPDPGVEPTSLVSPAGGFFMLQQLGSPPQCHVPSKSWNSLRFFVVWIDFFPWKKLASFCL